MIVATPLEEEPLVVVSTLHNRAWLQGFLEPKKIAREAG
jgi:hypothetical protein